MIVIGIVGPPAGGKSTVARQLTALGAVWLDADALAHQVLEQPQVRDQLVAHFGPRVAGPSGIDRHWLASQVFGADPTCHKQLRWLEATIHPPTLLLLQKQLVEAANRRVPAALLDVPLLFESGWDLLCDSIWCLDTPLEKRRQWVQRRGWSEEELRTRETRQLPLAEKKRRSTEIVANFGDLDALTETVRKLWTQLTTQTPSRSPASNPFSDDNTHCTGPLPSS